MSKYDCVSPEAVREILCYDAATGLFRWRPRGDAGWDKHYSGAAALTTKDRHGYLTGVIRGHRFFAHRVAIAWVTGAWPDGEVDHINHDRADNRAENLRVVTRSANRKNIRKQANNTSGRTGVHWASNVSLWVAQIMVGGRKKHLGCFATEEEAAAAREAAERRYDFHPNHGKET